MGSSAGPARSSNGNWKNRFNAKQLERKRLSDRLNQRRTRQQTKEYVAELEERVELLSRGDHATVIKRLIDENKTLRASLNRCQAKMDTVLVCTTNCLDTGDGGGIRDKASRHHAQSHSENVRSSPKETDMADNTSSYGAPSDQSLDIAYHHMNESPAFTTSIIFKAARLVLPSDFGLSTRKITKEEWLQSILMWKIVESHGQDYSFLISHFNLDKEPIWLTVDKIEKAVTTPNFDSQILSCLTNGTEFPDPVLSSSNSLTKEILEESEKQRRCIMFCAFQLFVSWHKHFKSPVESGLVFWAIFRYFMLLTLPTEDNFRKTPSWLIPTPSQLFCEHPGFIDFLVWPDLRERLSTTWGHYDEQNLVKHLIESFEVKSEKHDEDNLLYPLHLDHEDNSIQLRPQFKPILDNVDWFRTKPDFAANFPDLMPFVIPPASNISKTPSNSGISNQEIVVTTERWSQRTEKRDKKQVEIRVDEDLNNATIPMSWTSSESTNILGSVAFNLTAPQLTNVSALDSLVEPDLLSHLYNSFSIPKSDQIAGHDDASLQTSSSDSASVEMASPTDQVHVATPPSGHLASFNEAYTEFCAAFAPFPPFCASDFRDPCGPPARADLSPRKNSN